jgi:4-amino-4-deoxy-L-arabinose transferase-like glycosyltransferase
MNRAFTDSLWDRLNTPGPAGRRHMLLVACVFALGFFLRFWDLGSRTEGMIYDEAYKGLDAISIREQGERPIFLDWNGGREALVGYVVAGMQRVFDYSIVSVRGVSALYGSLMLVFFYFFASKLWSRDVALIATLLMAVSKYHILHSRIGVRAGQFAMFEVAALCFLAAGLYAEKRRTLWLALSGLFTGLGFHTYIAYRIFPAVVIVYVLSRERWTRLRAEWKGAILGVLLAAVVVAPLASFYIRNYESMTDRMKRTAVWNQKGKNRDESPVKLILQSTVQTLGMFNFKGDRIERHNVAPEPQLSPFAGPFFLAGVAFTLFNLRRRLAFFLLGYLFLMLLPGFLSVDAPNTARVLGSIPPAMILCSLGLAGAVRILAGWYRPAAAALVAASLAGSACTGILDTWVRYPERIDSLPPQVSNIWGLDREPVRAAALLNSLGERCRGYATPLFFFHSTTEYLTYSKSEHGLYAPGVNLRKQTPPGKIAVVVLQQNPAMNLWYLRDDDGKRFYKWWNQRYGFEIPWIRSTIRAAYGNHPQLMKNSDQRLLDTLRRQYPQGRYLDFQTFGAYIVRP